MLNKGVFTINIYLEYILLCLKLLNKSKLTFTIITTVFLIIVKIFSIIINGIRKTTNTNYRIIFKSNFYNYT